MNRSSITLLKFLDKFLHVPLSLLRHNSRRAHLTSLKTVGIIKLSAMGDALCLLPTVRELKKILPKAKIVWITTNRVHPELFKGCKLVDEIVILRLSSKVILRMIKLILRRVDMCFDFDQYYRISELLSLLTSRGKSVGFKTELKGATFFRSVDYDRDLNEKILFSKLIEKVFSKPVKIDSRIPELLSGYSPPEKVKTFLNDHPGEKIFVYPGSSGNASFRRWPLGKYLALADRIKDYSPEFEIIFVGGPEELNIKEKINKRNYVEIVNEFNLIDILYFFSLGRLFIGNDAGLLHLAEAGGLKSVSVFGPNSWSKWGSLLGGSRGIEISLDCRPCIRQYQGIVPRNCRLGNVECLDRISVASVYDEVVKILANSIE